MLVMLMRREFFLRKHVLIALAGCLFGAGFPKPLSAKSFTSGIKFKVYVRAGRGLPDRLLGTTPTRKTRPLRIPSGVFWYVQPLDSLTPSKMKWLAAELRLNEVPGLDLSDHWELTDAHMAMLKPLPALRMLNIARTPVGDEGLEAVAHFRRLRILAVGENTTDAGIKHLQTLKNLVDLNLDRAGVTDEGLATLTSLQKLQILDLSSTRVSDRGLQILSQLPHLRSLVLGGAITDGAGPGLGSLSALEELDFSQTQITHTGLTFLSQLPRLRAITVNRTLNDRGLEALARLPTLKSLDLSRTRVSDAGLGVLANHPALEELAITETRITNAGLASVAQLAKLRILEASDTRMTTAGLVPLAKLPNLQALSFSGKNLKRADIQNMSHVVHVKTLLLNGMVLPAPVIRRMKTLAGLPKTTSHAQARALSAPVAGRGLASLRKVKPAVSEVRPTLHAPQPIQPSPLNAEAAPASIALNPASPAAVTRPPSELIRAPQAMPLEDSSRPPIAAPTLARATVPQEEEVLGAPKLKDRGPMARSPMEMRRPPSPDLDASSASEENAAAGTPKGISDNEESILRAIALEAKKSRTVPAPSLAGLRHLSGGSSITDVIAADSGVIDLDDQKPENFLGEIEIKARRR